MWPHNWFHFYLFIYWEGRACPVAYKRVAKDSNSAQSIRHSGFFSLIATFFLSGWSSSRIWTWNWSPQAHRGGRTPRLVPNLSKVEASNVSVVVTWWLWERRCVRGHGQSRRTFSWYALSACLVTIVGTSLLKSQVWGVGELQLRPQQDRKELPPALGELSSPWPQAWPHVTTRRAHYHWAPCSVGEQVV